MKRIGRVLIALAIGTVVIVMAMAKRGSLRRHDPGAASVKAEARGAGASLRPQTRSVPPQTRLPAALVEVAAKLFDQGFGDPRGCEYREVELAGYANADASSLVPASPTPHATVQPAAGEKSLRFTVNGARERRRAEREQKETGAERDRHCCEAESDRHWEAERSRKRQALLYWKEKQKKSRKKSRKKVEKDRHCCIAFARRLW
jgi:hypothetical protein